MEVLSSLFPPFSRVFVVLESSGRTGRHFPLRIQLQASPAALPRASLPSLAWASPAFLQQDWAGVWISACPGGKCIGTLPPAPPPRWEPLAGVSGQRYSGHSEGLPPGTAPAALPLRSGACEPPEERVSLATWRRPRPGRSDLPKGVARLLRGLARAAWGPGHPGSRSTLSCFLRPAGLRAHFLSTRS